MQKYQLKEESHRKINIASEQREAGQESYKWLSRASSPAGNFLGSPWQMCSDQEAEVFNMAWLPEASPFGLKVALLSRHGLLS